MTDSESIREAKLKDLRSRVRTQLQNEEIPQKNTQKNRKKGLLERSRGIEKSNYKKITKKISSRIDEKGDDETIRIIGAWFIAIGSIIGLMTGALLLTGNPNDLVQSSSSLFVIDENVNVSGTVLLDEVGTAVSGVSIKLLEPEGRVIVKETITNDAGVFLLSNVMQEKYILQATKQNYTTLERLIIPDQADRIVLTLSEGDGLVQEQNNIQESNLSSAVALSTFIGVFTILMSLVGVHAFFEAKRGQKYRRTMYLAGISMFSRGLIVVGPAITLAGMGLIMISKRQFEDVDSINQESDDSDDIFDDDTVDTA